MGPETRSPCWAARRAGIDTAAAGSKPGVIGDAVRRMEGVSVGTRFHAQSSPLENRKRWIFGAPPAGEITVDMRGDRSDSGAWQFITAKRHAKA